MPVDPGSRQVRERTAVRLVVRCADQVLLIADSDPGISGSHWWVTPGGGIDAGETAQQAAVRELAEETGLQISEDQLIGPIGSRYVIHGYSDQILQQQETFFAIDVEKFTPDTAGYTEDEKICMGEPNWLNIDDFAAGSIAGVPVWPANLVELFNAKPGDFFDLGVMEESTVPVKS